MKRKNLAIIGFGVLGVTIGGVLMALPSCTSQTEYDAVKQGAMGQARRNEELLREQRQSLGAPPPNASLHFGHVSGDPSTDGDGYSSNGQLALRDKNASKDEKNSYTFFDQKDEFESGFQTSNARASGGGVSQSAVSRSVAPGSVATTDLSLAKKSSAATPALQTTSGNAGVADGAPVAGKHPLRDRAGEELWVIERAPRDEWTRAPKEDDLGPGALVTCPPGEQREVPVPLEHTDVQAHIDGYIATVNVKQSFHNPYASKIEAVYVFPLPDNAAVNEFIMTIGDRQVRGIVRERAEAQRIYNEARAQGYTASLLTQERPNIFTQKVANIEPGKSIDVDIRYFNPLVYDTDSYEFSFPMVVGPRFNPPGFTSGVGAVPRGAAPNASGQATQVSYLAPGERSGHDISIAVDINALVPLQQVECITHDASISRTGPTTARVVLSPKDGIPNRDFVLRYKVAAADVQTAITMHRNQSGDGYFTMMIVPPADLANVYRAPVEMVFVVDRSGSMDGRPIEQARLAATRGLQRLQPGDSFQVIDFAETTSKLGSRPLEATPENIQRGLDFISRLDAKGGTMMLNGMNAALGFPHDREGRQRYVCFLTDGYIGNEDEIFAAEHNALNGSRIFAFGIGSSVNRHLINGMGRVGNGASGFSLLQESPEDVIDAFMERVSHPALSQLSIDWGGAKVTDVYPSTLPDLFVGRPIIITGRIAGGWKNPVKLCGTVQGQKLERTVSTPTEPSPRNPAVAFLWARAKIAELTDSAAWKHSSNIEEQIKRVALDYGLMSQFTAMLAVDATRQTEGSFGTTVAVPVPVPDGVRYDTTVTAGGH